MVGKERLVGHHRVSPCSPRGVSAQCKERLVTGRIAFTFVFFRPNKARVYIMCVLDLDAVTLLHCYAVTFAIFIIKTYVNRQARRKRNNIIILYYNKFILHILYI